MVFEVLESIPVLLASLIHADHGLDLRGTEGKRSPEVSRAPLQNAGGGGGKGSSAGRHLDHVAAVVRQILLPVFELPLLLVALPVSLPTRTTHSQDYGGLLAPARVFAAALRLTCMLVTACSLDLR